MTLWSGPQHTPQLSAALDGPDMQQQQWTADSTQQFLLGLALLTAGLIAMTCARAFLYAFAGLKVSSSALLLSTCTCQSEIWRTNLHCLSLSQFDVYRRPKDYTSSL